MRWFYKPDKVQQKGNLANACRRWDVDPTTEVCAFFFFKSLELEEDGNQKSSLLPSWFLIFVVAVTFVVPNIRGCWQVFYTLGAEEIEEASFKSVPHPYLTQHID